MGDPSLDTIKIMKALALDTRYQRLIRAGGLLLGLYFAFTLGWFLVGGIYAQAFRAGNEFVFGNMFENGYIDFLSHYDDPDEHKDTLVYLFKRLPNGQLDRTDKGYLVIDSRYHGYTPLIITMALALATPIPWRRRSLLIVISLVTVHFLIFFKIWLIIFETGAMPEFAMITVSSVIFKTVATLQKIFSYIENSYIFPLICWIIASGITLRSQDWKIISGQTTPKISR